jgi:hypothetical protein
MMTRLYRVGGTALIVVGILLIGFAQQVSSALGLNAYHDMEPETAGFGFVILGMGALVSIYAFLANRSLTSGEKRRCPYCAELVQLKAKLCRFCSKEI